MKIFWTLLLLSLWCGSSPGEARRICRRGCGGSGGGRGGGGGGGPLTPEQRTIQIIAFSITGGLVLIVGVSCIWLKCIKKRKAFKISNQSESPSKLYDDQEAPAY